MEEEKKPLEEYQKEAFDPQNEFFKVWMRLGSANDLYEKLAQKCYGQDEALRKASLLIYAYLRGLAFRGKTPRLNFLIEGSSGCGKTTFAKALQEILDPVPVVITDASMITSAGYTGAQSSDIFESPFLQQFGYAGIVILDEADKLMTPQYDAHGANTSVNALNNFLKMLDGDTVLNRQGDEINCKRTLFICMGAFSDVRGQEQSISHIGFGSETEIVGKREITKDVLSEYCQSEQFIGRFLSIIPFNKPSRQVYQRVAIDSIKEIASVYGEHNVKQLYSNIPSIVEASLNSEYGCRNIRGDVWDYFLTHNECFTGTYLHN